MKNNLKMLTMLIIATFCLQETALRADDALIITIPAGKSLKSLRIKDVFNDDVTMFDQQLNTLRDELGVLAKNGGGVISGIITKDGTRVAFELPGKAADGLSIWVGMSLAGTLTSLIFTTNDDTTTSVGIPADIQDNTPVYIIQQNSNNSIRVPTQQKAVPHFIYIDVPTHQGLVTVTADGGGINWSDAPNWGDLQGFINRMVFGQEISGTCFGEAGLSIPYVSNFAFSGKPMDPAKKVSYAFQPFLTDESGAVLPHGAQQPDPSVGILKKGDQVVFRKLELVSYNTKIVKDDGTYLYMIEFGDSQGNIARLAPDWFQHLKDVVSLINVPKKGYDWDNTVFEQASDDVLDAGESVGDTVESVGKSAGKTVRDMTDSVGKLIEDAGKSAGDTAVDALDAAGDIVKDTLDTVGDAAEDTLTAAGGFTKYISDSAGNTISTAGRSSGSVVKKTSENTKNAINTAGKVASKVTKDMTKSAADAVKDAGASAGKITEDVTKSAAGTVKDVTKSASSTVRSVGESGIVKGAGMIASVFNGKAFERSQGMEYNGSVKCTFVYNEAKKMFCPQFKTNYNYSHWSIHPHRHFSRREAPLTFNTAGDGNLKDLKYILYKFADAQTNKLEMLQKIVFDPIVTKNGTVLWDQGHTEPYKPFCAESKKQVSNC